MRALRFFSMVSVLLLAACGGGGGSGSSAPPPGADTLSGVAAVGAPIANAAIQIMCASGSTLTTTTASTGAWQVTISGQTLPCAVELSGGTINDLANTLPYYSIATGFGTVNVTPLTNLIVANVAGTATPDTWFAGLTPAAFAQITSTSVNTALANQCAAFSGLTPLCTTNPITTVFTATIGDNMDNMLIALQIAMDNASISYAALLDNAATDYAALVAGFNTSLAAAYTNTAGPINATAITTAKNLTVGMAMISFSPILPSGGAIPYTYSYTGTLPTGLNFDTSTGVVSGTPTAIYATADMVFSVTDANNVVASTTSTVSFTVSTASSGGSGTLTVANAPANANIGGSFVADAQLTTVTVTGEVKWIEGGNSARTEGMTLKFDINTGVISMLSFFWSDGTVAGFPFCGALIGIPCNGAVVNRTAGTLTLTNTSLSNFGNPPTINLTGTLNFTPF